MFRPNLLNQIRAILTDNPAKETSSEDPTAYRKILNELWTNLQMCQDKFQDWSSDELANRPDVMELLLHLPIAQLRLLDPSDTSEHSVRTRLIKLLREYNGKRSDRHLDIKVTVRQSEHVPGEHGLFLKEILDFGEIPLVCKVSTRVTFGMHPKCYVTSSTATDVTVLLLLDTPYQDNLHATADGTT